MGMILGNKLLVIKGQFIYAKENVESLLIEEQIPANSLYEHVKDPKNRDLREEVRVYNLDLHKDFNAYHEHGITTIRYRDMNDNDLCVWLQGREAYDTVSETIEALCKREYDREGI
jgi:hypothetical protein